MERKKEPKRKSRIQKAVDHSPLRMFFLLAFACSWSCWGVGSFKNDQFFLILGSFCPALSALWIAFVRDGREGLARIIKKLGAWRQGWQWYVFCFFSTYLIIRIAIALFAVPDGRTALNADLPLKVLPLIFAYVFIFSVLGEEVGWRGYALPCLLKRHGAVKASLLLGFLWSIWHLPLFFLPGNFHQWIPFPWFLMQSIGLTLLMTYLYGKTNGSLLMASLFHTASNVTIGLMPVLPTAEDPDLTLLKGSIAGLYLLVGLIGWIERKNSYLWKPGFGSPADSNITPA